MRASRLFAHDPFVITALWVTNKPKYVNMADINVTLVPDRSTALESDEKAPVLNDVPAWDLIELLFFAYRDFVSDPDSLLENIGFGRAHHRVLHFVNRNPGMKVAELLHILKITKQSLGRVLKQLIDEGYIAQREGAKDRRQRLLYATAKGEQLALQLANLQTSRIARALGSLRANAHQEAREFLLAMIDAKDRDRVLRFVDRDERTRRSRT
jgi:DNA-binding MarR family transcriptional regulator